MNSNRFNLLGLLCFLCFGQSLSPILAESSGRISERKTSEWQWPQREDFYDYLQLVDKTFEVEEKFKSDELESAKSLASTQKLLGQSGLPKSTRVGLYLRLAELYTRQLHSERDKKLAVYKSLYARWLDQNFLATLPEPVLKGLGSEALAGKAIDVYRDLFNEYPEFNNDPALLYNMAKLQLLNDNKNAELYLEKLIKTFGKDPLAMKALLALAEFHYNTKNFRKASFLYAKASQSKQPSVAIYARYKLAWLAIFEAMTKGGISGSGATKSENILRGLALDKMQDLPKAAAAYLKKEVIADLVWLWSEGFQEQAASAYFLTVLDQEEAYLSTLERIAWKYEKQGNAAKAREFYHALFRKAPSRQHHMRLQLRLIELQSRNHLLADFIPEVKSLATTYADKKGLWYRSVQNNKEYLQGLTQTLQSYFFAKAVAYFKAFQNAKNSDTLRASNVLFALYLSLFPDGKDAYESRFAFASSLEILGNIKDAVLQYHRVAKIAGPLTHHRQQAAEKMIALQVQAVKVASFPALPPSGSLPKPVGIPEKKQLLIEVSDTYVALFPAATIASSLRFSAAKILFDYGQYDAALQRFMNTLSLDPAAQESKALVRLVLGYFEQQHKWQDLAQWSEKFIKFEQYLGAEVGAYLNQKLRQALWQIAVLYKDSKKLPESAAAFLAYQKRLPTDALADKALFLAMSLIYALGDGKKGIEIGKTLIATYPQSSFGAQTLYSMALSFQNLHGYQEAAEILELFAKRYPLDSKAAQAQYQAGQLYAGLKNLDRSALLLEGISHMQSPPELAGKALLEAGETYVVLERYDAAVSAYAAYIQKYSGLNPESNLYSATQIAVLTLAKEPANLNQVQFMNLENQLQGKDRNFALQARNALLRYYLDVIGAMMQDFSQQKVSYNDFNAYDSSIQSYLEYVANLEGIFTRLSKIASSEGVVETYYKMGELYDQALANFTSKWNMEGMQPEEMRKILNAKERVTLSLREKMLTAYKSSYELAQQNKIFSDYRRKSLEKLAAFYPKLYKVGSDSDEAKAGSND